MQTHSVQQSRQHGPGSVFETWGRPQRLCGFRRFPRTGHNLGENPLALLLTIFALRNAMAPSSGQHC